MTDLGIICLREGDARRAATLLEEALSMVGQFDDSAWESDVLGHLGLAILASGDAGRAKGLLERGLASARRSGNRYSEKAALEHLGLASSTVRRFDQALVYYERAGAIARELGDQKHESKLLWFMAAQHAELSRRDQAMATAESAVELMKRSQDPESLWFADRLQKYREGGRTGPTDEAAGGAGMGVLFGNSVVTSATAGQSDSGARPLQTPGSPGLLSMAMSAGGAMAKFLGSGLKTTSKEIYEERLRTCATCDHHTGVRCRICGCITSIKARMLHEDCPITKWNKII